MKGYAAVSRQGVRAFASRPVFVAGGSSGLGKEDFQVTGSSRGAHVTIFARRQETLDEARNEILAARQDTKQDVNAVSLDLGKPHELDAAFRSQARIPDVLYCVAGGTSTEIGFMTDIDAGKLESCMRNNYFTAAYAAQSMLKIWTEDDKNAERLSPRLRQIAFINSAAAFLGLPGYAAYTSSKCAVRGLTDTLRMEALRLSSPATTYTIHCAFPSTFISPAFLEEQKSKPELTKRMEDTMGSMADLEQRFPVARGIIAGCGERRVCALR
ncbi:MAG: hypothetical protein ALECFALPRED_003225 [Alectoria fallacina]|uniref:Uncharacterized protein n=1 Tax=Alectoria fallacina TaxID=1903189 RepID=A0A8H3FJS7_9LECA|nr:MAG: hypothetical protein ALECFALPRED_003225 [Alectoria fallacina]